MKRIRQFLRNFLNSLMLPEMLVLPGQLAFFFFLSVVPIITVIAYSASSFNLPYDAITSFITKTFGDATAAFLIPTVTNATPSMGFIVTLVIGYIIASNGAASMIITSNTIYNIKDSGFLKRRIKAFIMTIFIVLLFLFLLIIPIFGNKIIDLIKYLAIDQNITDNIITVFNILKGPLSWLIIFIFIKILYTMAPDRKMPSSYVNYGAVFTTIGWILSTEIYSYYINHFAKYYVYYGTLANIVILMLWVYLLAYIFVIGMALNSREETKMLEKTGQIKIIKED